MTTGGALLVATALLGPLVFSLWSLDAFDFPKALLLRAAALALLAVGLVAACERRLSGLAGAARDPIVWGLAALLASAALSTVAGGNPWLSVSGAEGRFSGLATFAAWTVLFFATRAAAVEPAFVFALLWSAFVGALGAAAYGACQLGGLEPIAWEGHEALGARARPGGTIGLANFLGEHLAVVLPLGLLLAHRAWRAGRRDVAVGVGAATCLGAFVAVASLARAAWLALAAAAVVLLTDRLRADGRRALAPMLAGLLLVVAMVGFWAGLSERGAGFRLEARRRLDSLARLRDETRVEYWRAAVQMLAERPALGVGPATFHLHFPRFQRAEHVLREWNAVPREAHNDALHLAATQGGVGLAALGLLATGLALGLLRARARARDRAQRALVAALAASLTAFAVRSLVSVTVIALGSLFVMLAALVSALAFGPERDAPRAPAPAALGGLLAGGSLAAAALLLGNALAAGGSQRPIATAAATAAIALAGLALAAAAARTESAAVAPARAPSHARPRDLRALALRAAAAALALLALHQWVVIPFRADALARRGHVLVREGDPRAAIPWLEAAVALAPRRAHLGSELGVAHHEGAGVVSIEAARDFHLDRAHEAHARAVALEPDDARRRAALARALAEAARLAPSEAAHERALAAFDEALARAPRDPIVLEDAARAALALGAVARGEGYARRALAVAPDHAPARAQLGMAAMLRGDFAAAARELEAARAANWRNDGVAEATGLANLAATRLALGDAPGALEAADAALARVPDYADARGTRERAMAALAASAARAPAAAP